MSVVLVTSSMCTMSSLLKTAGKNYDGYQGAAAAVVDYLMLRKAIYVAVVVGPVLDGE